MKRSTIIRAAHLLLLAALAMSTGLRAEPSSPAGAVKHLALSGANTMVSLMSEVIKRYQSLHPAIQFDLAVTSSRVAVSDTRAGKSDIGMVARVLTENERDLQGIPIARDGVAVIVQRDNPVNGLSDQQLADIYSGKVVNWRQVGGRDAPLHVLTSGTESGYSNVFAQYLHLSDEQFKVQRKIILNADRIAAVAADPLAIIFISLGEAERKARAGAAIKLLAVGGVAATSSNVRNGDYPISLPLMLLTRGKPTGAARAFMDFCLSAQITDLLQAADFVPYLD